MDVQFIASIAVIAPDPSVSRRFYVDALGLPLMGSEDDYLHSEDIDGSKSFGVWPLTQAAQACFGTPDWPADRPVPQASIEFEVADADAVEVGADELKEKGFTLLHEAHTEPWGQTVEARSSLSHKFVRLGVVVDWKTAGTIFVALVGFLVTYVVNLRLARRKDRLERINEQLRDLYGPLYALEISARSAWMEFRKQYRPDRRYWQDDPPPTAEEAQAWRTWMKSVFMPINRRMRDVVVTKAHLIDGSEMPQSLRDLAAHVSAYEPNTGPMGRQRL